MSEEDRTSSSAGQKLQPVWLENYLRLLDKVDGFARAVQHGRAEAGAALACARGCSACCFTRLSVLPVEAASLGAWLDAGPELHPSVGAGPAELPSASRALAGPRPCPFLDTRGDCAVYPVRPLICRTHGLPIRLEKGVDICPLSGQPEVGEALNLELVNALLTAVNARYCEQAGVPDTRVALEVLRLRVQGSTQVALGEPRPRLDSQGSDVP